MVLNAFQRARAELPWLHPRHGMVHCQILSEGQLRRMAELDVTAFVQPVFINGDMHIAPGRLGGNRLAHSYAWGDMERLGLHMAFGHRLPVERFHPLRGSTAPSPGGTSPETAPSCRSRPLRPTRRCTLIPQAALTPPVRSASKGAYAPACWPTSSWWTATC